MAKIVGSQSTTAGLPPGTVVHVGEAPAGPVRISVITYDEGSLEETPLDPAVGCPTIKPAPAITWVNVVGVADAEALERLGQCVNLHPLVVEDIANTGQRVKLEDYTDYLYLVVKSLSWDSQAGEVTTEQISLLVGDHWVLSFQEAGPDAFESVAARLRNEKARARKMGADYLAYELIDAVVDHYFETIEQVGEQIELLEDEVVTDPQAGTIEDIHRLKRDMILLRRAVWPLREVVGGFERLDSELVKPTTGVYLRDVYDHTIQVIDTIEAFRDVLSGLLDIYLSSISNRMNAVMKVLTIIATIFIPLSFLAGVYGMNFKGIPELEWRWGYAAFWAICAVTTVVMVAYFKKKRWI